MKPFCIATLLICGTVLVGLPFVANLVYMKMVAGLLTSGSSTSVTLAGVLGHGAYWAPIIIGGLMILVGIAGSFSTRKQSTNS